ncbi:MAG: endolytic transglycosylase MltG [Pseudomonadales bacterium]|nr:endolytic transglycosylase MltG [Pseudomonadales bacterium]
MRPKSRFLLRTFITVLFILTLVGLEQLYSANNWLRSPLAIKERFVLTLKPGAVFTDLSQQIEAKAPLRSKLWALYARLTGISKHLKAGEYSIDPGMAPIEITQRIVSGNIIQYSFRIQEGWTVRQLRHSLQGIESLQHQSMYYTEPELIRALGLSENALEGLFFPDTYMYAKNDWDISLLRRANRKMQDVLHSEWINRSNNLPLQGEYDALKLASIIEKETGIDSDRASVSQVFNNRLFRKMRLQTDPTVIYGLGSRFDGNLTRAHLNTDGVYNTYMRKGLPPTPISLPGLQSIRAALHPSPGNLLYFVGRGDGSSQFSESLDEHLSAVRRYQLGAGNR